VQCLPLKLRPEGMSHRHKSAMPELEFGLHHAVNLYAFHGA
jgi:hypothetical protein